MSANSTAFAEAVSSSTQNLLVIAPPGCGKTELLARRAELLIRQLRPNQKILALTFSNRAKANLNSRLAIVLGAERKRRYVTVHNFHGHAAEILRSHGRTLNIDPGFEMPDKRTQADAITPFLTGMPEDESHDLARRIENDLREAKQGPNTDANVLHTLSSIRMEVSLQIETTRQSSGTLYFDDLLRHAQRLIRVKEIASLYRNHYGAILVDEFQDLSPQQLDLALRSCEQSRTFVGDPLQGIYSWTGAKPVDVGRRLQRISGAPVGLGVSYRSSPKVLSLLNTVSVGLGGRALEPDNADSWHEGGIAAGVVFNTGVEEAAFINEVSSQILAKQPTATIGVICRSGWRRKPIDAVFAKSDLPSTRWDLTIDNAGVIDLIGDAITRLGGNPDVSALKNEILGRIDGTDVDTAAEVVDALEQLEELSGLSGSIASALGHLRIRQDSDSAIGAGVHLLNAHTGKGQQFDWVFIPGFEKGNIPSFLAKTPSQVQEEHRVLLVMLSRARHGVILTRANSLISKKGSPYSTTASPWTNEVDPGVVAGHKELFQHISGLPT
ncbi:UvrD-helicase domain-containing protein [Arthrobacter sp. KNU40]|uniref:UvrD-helicase domain-containing protein n=1 Tax=Arthrobacter sp. KNU40 TaxID=3447965 RepID=UPI003F60004B